MSVVDVPAVLERMRWDVAFRERVLAIHDIDDRMALLTAEGYDCKIGDVQHYMTHFVSNDGAQAVVLTEKKGCNGIYYGFCF